MRNLLEFLARFSNAFLFFFLETVAVVLIVLNNDYQKSAFFSSCNTLAASMYQATSKVTNYFALQADNERLTNENVALQNRINDLENLLSIANDSATHTPTYRCADKNITYVAARVINASTNRQHNYITINKGLRDGVLPDMAVINDQGVLGIVSAASDHFALVIPILHTDMSISCKFAQNGYVGALRWDGRDIQRANLMDIARHVDVQIGDTILTSGLSTIFPPNIPIGVVEKKELTDHDAFYHITVKLAVDFKRLGYATVIQNHNQAEQIALEDSVNIQ